MERTLTLDDDVLAAAEELASLQRRSLGSVISELSRRGLHSEDRPTFTTSDLPALPLRDMTPVTLEFVNDLRDGLNS